MDYTVKKIQETEIEILIKVEKEKIDNLMSKKIHQLQNTLNISGFRKGKIPIQIIKKRYQNSVKQEVINTILDNNIKKILVKEKIKPINNPKVDIISTGDIYNFKVYFEIFPTVKIKNLSFKLKKPYVELTEYDVNKIIENLKYELGTWENIEDKTKIGDKIKIEYNILEKKTIPSNREGKPLFESFTIEEENYLNYEDKKFILNLKDLEKNKTIKILAKNALSEKNQYFNINLLHVKRKKLLDSNKKISEVIKSKSENIQDIRTQIKINTNKQIKEIATLYLRNECLKKLYEENKINIPNSFLNYKNDNIEDKMDIADLKKKLATEILIKEIIKNENIKIKKLDIQNKLESIYSSEHDLNLMKNKDKEMLMVNIKNQLLIDHVIMFILKKSEIKNIKVSLENLLSEYKI